MLGCVLYVTSCVIQIVVTVLLVMGQRSVMIVIQKIAHKQINQFNLTKEESK